MYERHVIGKIGEEIAVRYLKQKGYKIIGRNFSCRQGELDIIAENDEYIIFIEVKTRSNYLYGTPAQAVGNTKKKHMKKVARYYLHIQGLERKYIRFDVIEVYVEKGFANVHHIPQIM